MTVVRVNNQTEFHYLKVIKGLSESLAFSDTNQDGFLDTQTELFEPCGIFCGFGCGGATQIAGKNYRPISEKALAKVEQDFLRGDSKGLENLAEKANALKRLQSGQCDDSTCNEVEQKKNIKLLVEQKNQRLNPYLVRAVEANWLTPSLAHSLGQAFYDTEQWIPLRQLAQHFFKKNYLNYLDDAGRWLAASYFSEKDCEKQIPEFINFLKALPTNQMREQAFPKYSIHCSGNEAESLQVTSAVANAFSNQARLWMVLGWQTKFGKCDGCEKKALAAYEKAIQLEPNNKEAHFELGHFFMFDLNSENINRDYEKAIGHLKKAVELNPKNPKEDANIYQWIARAHFRLKKYEGALQAHQKALELDPESYGIYVDVAKIYEEMGRKKEAIQYYQKAIEALTRENPESDWVSIWKRELKVLERSK